MLAALCVVLDHVVHVVTDSGRYYDRSTNNALRIIVAVVRALAVDLAASSTAQNIFKLRSQVLSVHHVVVSTVAVPSLGSEYPTVERRGFRCDVPPRSLEPPGVCDCQSTILLAKTMEAFSCILSKVWDTTRETKCVFGQRFYASIVSLVVLQRFADDL